MTDGAKTRWLNNSDDEDDQIVNGKESYPWLAWLKTHNNRRRFSNLTNNVTRLGGQHLRTMYKEVTARQINARIVGWTTTSWPRHQSISKNILNDLTCFLSIETKVAKHSSQFYSARHWNLLKIHVKKKGSQRHIYVMSSCCFTASLSIRLKTMDIRPLSQRHTERVVGANEGRVRKKRVIWHFWEREKKKENTVVCVCDDDNGRLYYI